MSAAMVWLTEDELNTLTDWYYAFASELVPSSDDEKLREKLEALQEEMHRGPGAGRVLARDLG